MAYRIYWVVLFLTLALPIKWILQWLTGKSFAFPTVVGMLAVSFFCFIGAAIAGSFILKIKRQDELARKEKKLR